MPHPAWITTLFFFIDLLIRLGFSARVIMRRLPVGTSLAWLTVILVFPFVGSLVYLFLGEHRLGHRRSRQIAAVAGQWHDLVTRTFPLGATQLSSHPLADSRLPHLAASTLRAAMLPGNRLQLLEDADAVFPALVADIDRARESCDLEFYIWSLGGRVDEVAAALKRAAARGVRCRLLVDAQGSAKFLKSGAVQELRQQDIQVQAALPSSLLTMPFVRPDLRLHRKIVVIDRQVGYTGSLNMADPHCFKQNAGVGQWVDAMARIEGPAVHALAASILASWCVEHGAEGTEAEWTRDAQASKPAGSAHVQVLPSGPAGRVEAIEQIVLAAIYSAKRELVLTTPYFVPTESLLTALLSAAGSGVKVTLIVPATVDSMIVHHASRAFQSDLVAAGVHVALFQGGLLHTKSITVDEHLSLFGTLNLDPRSLQLNFEITLAVYDVQFTAALKALQARYLHQSQTLDLATCRGRSPLTRLIENTARLLGPVL